LTAGKTNPFAWLLAKFDPRSKQYVGNSKQLAAPLSTNNSTANESPCCGDIVHIAYRGVSDDRLYLAYDRKWQEVKFFRPKNLRVFCQKCRGRIY